MPETKGLKISLSDCRDAWRFGIHTQARSAKFKTGLVLLSLPNRIPAMTQNRTFVESSSAIRRSERPKMVSFGIFKRFFNNILLTTVAVATSSIKKRAI